MSGKNLNRRAVWHQLSDFVDFFIRNRDAAVGPIPPTVRRAEVAISVKDSMDRDVPTWRDA